MAVRRFWLKRSLVALTIAGIWIVLLCTFQTLAMAVVWTDFVVGLIVLARIRPRTEHTEPPRRLEP